MPEGTGDANTLIHKLRQLEGAVSYRSSIGVDELPVPLKSREG